MPERRTAFRSRNGQPEKQSVVALNINDGDIIPKPAQLLDKELFVRATRAFKAHGMVIHPWMIPAVIPLFPEIAFYKYTRSPFAYYISMEQVKEFTRLFNERKEEYIRQLSALE